MHFAYVVADNISSAVTLPHHTSTQNHSLPQYSTVFGKVSILFSIPKVIKYLPYISLSPFGAKKGSPHVTCFFLSLYSPFSSPLLMGGICRKKRNIYSCPLPPFLTSYTFLLYSSLPLSHFPLPPLYLPSSPLLSLLFFYLHLIFLHSLLSLFPHFLISYSSNHCK
jgi:hypothetical protein